MTLYSNIRLTSVKVVWLGKAQWVAERGGGRVFTRNPGDEDIMSPIEAARLAITGEVAVLGPIGVSTRGNEVMTCPS